MSGKATKPEEAQAVSRQPVEPLHPPQERTEPVAPVACPSSNATTTESQQLELLFRLSSDGIVLHEVNAETTPGRFLQANEAMCRLLGYSLDELRRLTPLDVMAPGEHLDMATAAAAIKRDGVLVHEHVVLSKDGRRIPVEICSRIFEHGGKRMAVSTVRDITGRKQSETALRDSERRLRLAMEGAQMGRWEWDLRAGSHFWSERVYELLGLATFRKACVETFLTRVHPDDKESLHRLASRVLVGQPEFHTEFRVVCRTGEPGGEIHWLACRGMMTRGRDGRPWQVMGTLHDVTSRKLMEQELRRLNDRLEDEVKAQTEQLQGTVDRLQDEVARRVLAEAGLRRQSHMLEGFFRHTITPLAFLDNHLRYVRVNEAYARGSGMTPEQLAGMDYFLHQSDPGARDIFRRVMNARQPYFAHARPQVCPGDPERRITYWDWQLTPLLNDGGGVQFLVLNLEDVTKEQVALQELEHRAAQLQKLTLELSQAEDSERKRLAGLLHDDLQQILAAAKFHVGLLAGHAEDPAVIREAAGEIKQMLKEAIDKSRSLSHELSPVFYQVDLCDVMKCLAEQMQHRHGLTVAIQVRGEIGSPSDAMKAFLYKAAHELLFNVIKHAGVHEAVLRLRCVRGQLRLTISDRGRGFDPGTLPRATGFGLLTIRERAELLGGRMTIRSLEGRGSTFLVAVPDVPAPAPEPAPEPAARAILSASEPETHVTGAAPSTLRILLVNDRKIVREGLTALLSGQTGIEVVGQAADGPEAIDLAGRCTPEVVVIDVAMPVTDIEKATRLIHERLPQTRIIVLSMHDEPRIEGRMRRAGAEACLARAASAADLLAAIRGRQQAR